MTDGRTYAVEWDPAALDAAAGYLDDQDGLGAVMDTADALAQDPRPDGAFAMGAHRYRLRVGRYRLYYDVDDEALTVTLIRCGRTN